MRDHSKENYPNNIESLTEHSVSDQEGIFSSSTQNLGLLDDELIELINLFLIEIKPICETEPLVDLFNQYFRDTQYSLVLINDKCQTLVGHNMPQNKDFDENQEQNFENIFSAEDIKSIKMRIKSDCSFLGTFKSVINEFSYSLLNYPIISGDMAKGYFLLILKPQENTVLQQLTIENESKYLINEFYKSLLDTIDGFYFIATSSLHFIYISEKVNSKLGFKPEELIGVRLEMIVPTEINTEFYQELNNLNISNNPLIGKSLVKKDVQIIDHKNTSRYYELNCQIFNNKESDQHFLLCTCIDIQNRKDNENTLEDDKNKAIMKDQMKSEFLSNMSHDIRTPLNGIIGFSSMLDKEDIDQEKRTKYMKIIRSSSKQLLTLVNDIIDFSKIEAGELKMFFKPSDVNQLIDELYFTYIQELERICKENIILKKVTSDRVKQMVIDTDEMRLQQVFINLLNNALKFTSSGEISFGYQISENETNQIRFFVKDTGIGIPKTQQDSIFSRYKQTKEGEKPKYKGTGLGLAISKGIVELLGSQLKVESKANVGSEFYFTLKIIDKP